MTELATPRHWTTKLGNSFINRDIPGGSEIVVSADPVVDPDPPPSSLRVAWWSEEFQAEVELRKEKQPDLRIALSKLAQPEAGQRIIGFQNLIDLIMNSNDSKTRQWEELFFELFILEPDLLTTNTTLDYLGRWLSPGSTEGLVSLNRLQSAYYANRLFTQLAFFEPATPHKNLMKRRTDALAKQSATLGMTITNGNDADARGRETESAVASEQWNYVVQNCWSAPARCAIVIQPLYELTKDKLDRTLLNQFRIRAIESILDVDQSRWKDLTEAIAQAIEVADEIRVNNWIRYFQTVEDREFGDFLGQLLIKKTGISPATNRLSEIKRLLSEVRMSYQNRLFQPILERNQRVEKYSSQAQQATKLHPTDVQPEVIARIAFAANVSLAMANAAQRDDQLFDDVDELLNNLVVNLI